MQRTSVGKLSELVFWFWLKAWQLGFVQTTVQHLPLSQTGKLHHIDKELGLALKTHTAGESQDSVKQQIWTSGDIVPDVVAGPLWPASPPLE